MMIGVWFFYRKVIKGAKFFNIVVSVYSNMISVANFPATPSTLFTISFFNSQ